MKNYKGFEYFEMDGLTKETDIATNPYVRIIDRRNLTEDDPAPFIQTNITIEELASHCDDKNYYDDRIKKFIDDTFFADTESVENTEAEATEPVEANQEEGSVDAPEEARVEAEEYAVNFTLSYSQYLKGQNKTEISDQEAAGLIASVVNFYENEAPSKEVRDFFEIPESLNDKIKAKQFNIATEVVSNDTNYQVFLVKYTLTFGERIVPQGSVFDNFDNVVDFTEVAPVDEPVEAITTEVGPESPVLTDPAECAEALGEPCQCEHCDCVKTEEGPVESCDGENCSEPVEVPSEEVPTTETAE